MLWNTVDFAFSPADKYHKDDPLLITLVPTPSPHPSTSAVPLDTNKYFCMVTDCFSMTEILAIWVPFVDVPFVLSQQVLICSVIFAVVLTKVLRRMNAEIEVEIGSWGTEFAGSNARHARRGCERLQEECQKWAFLYVDCQNFVSKFNAFFGGIVLVSVAMDFLSALGNGANILAGSRASVGLIVTCTGLSLLFLSYTTVLFIPFVLVCEESTKMDGLVHQLLWTVKRHVYQGRLRRRLQASLREGANRVSHKECPTATNSHKKMNYIRAHTGVHR
ncbi:hypothetical protein BV898_16393 [Hypsibius exemplaris]|uniref:Uncharacterized protein n=1 Tax=Hypsibius exemplaris TaxID=2072580 RepID=A0A9X6RL28_HYPEX|nr:hypothetical protein BV898_16393 [Hypsibius exemplaris]